MENKKEEKALRILNLYVRLKEGKCLNKSIEADRFGIDARSVQRDIDTLRCFLADQPVHSSAGDCSIVYDKRKNGYIMLNMEETLLTNQEILAISKILLASRFFTTEELDYILDKMLRGCVSPQSYKLIRELLANEKFHYATVSDSSAVKDRLWELGCAIKQHNLLELTYRKQVPDCEIVTRVIEPVGIIFSEYYFYLNAYVVEKRAGKYIQLYDTPTTFRIDRIVQYHERKESFRIPYKDTFHPGEFHNRIQFMFAGELQKVKFRYVGASVDAILDRLPTAQIIREKDHEYILSAEVYEDGFVRWLLSQGRAVELLEPVALRGRVREILSEMASQYN